MISRSRSRSRPKSRKVSDIEVAIKKEEVKPEDVK